MVQFPEKYKAEVLAVLRIVGGEFQNCFDYIDRQAAKRMEDSLASCSPQEGFIALDERWFYIISNAINLLDDKNASQYRELQEYIRKLKG